MENTITKKNAKKNSREKNRKTFHAQRRCQQRGKREADIFLIRKYGKKEYDGDILYTLTRLCILKIIHQLRHQNAHHILQRLDHLIGWRVVVFKDTNAVKTVYPITRHGISRRRKRGYSWLRG